MTSSEGGDTYGRRGGWVLVNKEGSVDSSRLATNVAVVEVGSLTLGNGVLGVVVGVELDKGVGPLAQVSEDLDEGNGAPLGKVAGDRIVELVVGESGVQAGHKHTRRRPRRSFLVGVVRGSLVIFSGLGLGSSERVRGERVGLGVV